MGKTETLAQAKHIATYAKTMADKAKTARNASWCETDIAQQAAYAAHSYRYARQTKDTALDNYSAECGTVIDNAMHEADSAIAAVQARADDMVDNAVNNAIYLIAAIAENNKEWGAELRELIACLKKGETGIAYSKSKEINSKYNNKLLSCVVISLSDVCDKKQSAWLIQSALRA